MTTQTVTAKPEPEREVPDLRETAPDLEPTGDHNEQPELEPLPSADDTEPAQDAEPAVTRERLAQICDNRSAAEVLRAGYEHLGRSSLGGLFLRHPLR